MLKEFKNYKYTDYKLIIGDKCVSKVQLFKNDKTFNRFMYEDVLSFCDNENTDIYTLDGLYVYPEFRNKGYGSRILKEVITTKIPENSIILTASAVLEEEYGKEPDVHDNSYFNKIYEIINNLHEFYIKSKFISINDFVNYEYKEAFIYIGNDIGKKIYHKIQDYLIAYSSKCE